MCKLFDAVFGLSLALSMMALSSGCIASAQNARDGQATRGRVVCKKETVVGSHLPRTVCRDAQTAEQDSERDRRTLERIQHDSTVVRPEQRTP